MKYIYSTSQMSKLSLTLRTFNITGSVAGLFLVARLSLKHKMVLKGVPRGGTRVDVEELWQEEAI